MSMFELLRSFLIELLTFHCTIHYYVTFYVNLFYHYSNFIETNNYDCVLCADECLPIKISIYRIKNPC